MASVESLRDVVHDLAPGIDTSWRLEGVPVYPSGVDKCLGKLEPPTVPWDDTAIPVWVVAYNLFGVSKGRRNVPPEELVRRGRAAASMLLANTVVTGGPAWGGRDFDTCLGLATVMLPPNADFSLAPLADRELFVARGARLVPGISARRCLREYPGCRALLQMLPSDRIRPDLHPEQVATLASEVRRRDELVPLADVAESVGYGRNTFRLRERTGWQLPFDFAGLPDNMFPLPGSTNASMHVTPSMAVGLLERHGKPPEALPPRPDRSRQKLSPEQKILTALSCTKAALHYLVETYPLCGDVTYDGDSIIKLSGGFRRFFNVILRTPTAKRENNHCRGWVAHGALSERLKFESPDRLLAFVGGLGLGPDYRNCAVTLITVPDGGSRRKGRGPTGSDVQPLYDVFYSPPTVRKIENAVSLVRERQQLRNNV